MAAPSQAQKVSTSVRQTIDFRQMKYKTIEVDHLTLFYREAGDPHKPTLLLLHGFPSTSHMYNDLINDLSANYHLVAPDYPGFGNSSLPSPTTFEYSFDHIANIMSDFIAAIGIGKFALYMQDYGGPIGMRIASVHPDKITALVFQNANAYNDGLGVDFKKILDLQQAGDTATVTKILQQIISFDGIKVQYTDGAADLQHIQPEAYLTDFNYMQRPGSIDIQAKLFYDYHNNLPKYTEWQQYLKTHRPPVLIVWGKNDPIFIAAGANAYLRDVPEAELHLLDGGHFALVEYHHQIADYISTFFTRRVLPFNLSFYI
jgi:pimeloyl-ACP methyl ester carboxylesterase